MEQKDRSGTSVSIIGGGLAGSLAAVLLGQRGYQVNVFEKREDSRSDQFKWEGKSINLALSARGRKALRKAGIEEQVVKKVRKIEQKTNFCAQMTYIPSLLCSVFQ